MIEERLSTPQIRRLANIPVDARVHIPDAWKTAGYQRREDNRFEFEPLFTDGTPTLSEPELLLAKIAAFRVQIDRHTVRDYTLN